MSCYFAATHGIRSFFPSGWLNRTQTAENVQEINQTLSILWLQWLVPNPLPLLLPLITRSSNLLQFILWTKPIFFPKSAECASKLASVLLPAETTGDVIGVIQHAAVILPVFQAVWLYLEHRIKTMQFLPRKLRSWGLSTPFKRNLFTFCPKYTSLLASGMFWQPKQACRTNGKQQYRKGISKENSHLYVLNQGFATVSVNYFVNIPK